MYSNDKLIPVRFLILIAHLIITITLLWTCKGTTKICLPQDYSQEVLYHHQLQLVVGLSITLGLIVFEMFTFLTGFTIFNTSSALLSVCCHTSANILMCYMIVEGWQFQWFWWIFAFCSVLPILYDTSIVLNVIIYKKY